MPFVSSIQPIQALSPSAWIHRFSLDWSGKDKLLSGFLTHFLAENSTHQIFHPYKDLISSIAAAAGSRVSNSWVWRIEPLGFKTHEVEMLPQWSLIKMQTSCTFHPTMTATQQRTNHGSTDQTLWPACSHCLLALLLVKYDPWSLLRAQVQTSHGLWLSTRRRTVQVQWYVYDYLLPRCATSQLPAHTSSALCYYGTHLQPGNKSLKPKQAEHPSFEIWIRKVNLGDNQILVESIDWKADHTSDCCGWLSWQRPWPATVV